MSINRGKQFESKLKSDFLNTMPNSTIDRIYDTCNGLIGVSNICDFVGYKYPHIYYIECKSTQENTFNFIKLTQYDKLVKKVGITGVRTGVVIWFINHDRVLYVPISTITKMKNDGLKSININKMKKEVYNYIEIPSIKKRVFMDSDYSVLLNLQEGE